MSFNENSKVGDLLKNEAAKAVVDKHIPWLTSSPRIGMAKMFTLKSLVAYSQGKITQDQLKACSNDLEKIS